MRYDVDSSLLPHSLSPAAGESVTIERKEVKKDPLPPFTIVGNGFTNRQGVNSLDVLEVCLQMNQAEMKPFQFLRNMFTVNTIEGSTTPSVVEPSRHEEFDKYLSTALMKNYRHLEYLQVVRRIKRGVYIVNPKVLVPSKHYIAMQVLWDSTKELHNDTI